jgi:hypothetical protein
MVSIEIHRRAGIALTGTLIVISTMLAGCSGSATKSNTADATSQQAPGARTSSPHVDAQPYFASSGGVNGYYFTSPSGKWRCAIIEDGSMAQAGCQPATNVEPGMGVRGAPNVEDKISHLQVQPNAIRVTPTNGAEFAHLGQPVFWRTDGEAKVLPYNRVLAAGGFSCNVQQTGVACKDDRSTQGFTFSTDGYSFTYTDVVSEEATAATSVTASDEPAHDACLLSTAQISGIVAQVTGKEEQISITFSSQEKSICEYRISNRLDFSIDSYRYTENKKFDLGSDAGTGQYGGQTPSEVYASACHAYEVSKRSTDPDPSLYPNIANGLAIDGYNSFVLAGKHSYWYDGGFTGEGSSFGALGSDSLLVALATALAEKD